MDKKTLLQFLLLKLSQNSKYPRIFQVTGANQNERKLLSTVLVNTNNSNRASNIFWALLRAHFNPRLTARAKTSLSRAQNIFMPASINSIVLLFTTMLIKEKKKQTNYTLTDKAYTVFNQQLTCKKIQTMIWPLSTRLILNFLS